MYQATYYIDKSNNTFADNLAAFGLAFVLNGVANGRARIRLEDVGYAFTVVCEPALKPEWVEQPVFFTGAPFLVTTKAGQKLVKGTKLSPDDLPLADGDTAVDYEVEKQRRADFFTQRDALSAEDRRALAQGTFQEIPQPHKNWEIFRAINPSALQGYNGVMAEWWRGRGVFPELLQVLLQMTAQSPNNVDGAEKAWLNVCKSQGWDKPKEATATQLLNPAQGKGVNSPKTEWRAPNNLKGFWLLEWLKAVGLFYGGITRIVANPKDPRSAKDRKTYVLVPVRLEWGKHRSVMQDFQRAMAGTATAVQLDIYAALRYTQAFIKHYEGARVEDLEADLFGHSPADLVSGLQMAFYKNLGNSSATMNIASINLPRWVVPRSREDLARLQAALDEHLMIVRSLDETRGDQFALLSSYRDFLSANDLDPFFEFTTAYSGFVISQYERRKFVRPFTTSNLEVLFMNSDDTRQTFSKIVQSEGFKNVAYAIRHSTVVPQSRKGRGTKPVVDVRYGLGQQLARKAAYPAEFLAEVTEFIHLYNAENAQLREKQRNPFRKNVTTADIEALTDLVDEFGSKVVCNMLVAYGYAREPYETEDDKEPTEAMTEAIEPGPDNNSDESEE